MTPDEEENAVRQLGELIGYGRTMQLCEQIWDRKTPGGAISTGPCTATLVPCPHPEDGRDANGHCDWCCGSGRITRKVLAAMTDAAGLAKAMEIVGNMRQSEAGLFDAAHSGQRGEDRSNALYDAYQAISAARKGAA